MAQLEPWERVLVYESFLESPHGQIGCITCHKGDENAKDKEGAHLGLVPYPSEEAETYCASCHTEEVETYSNSLHKTQEGYFQRFMLRAGYDLRDPGHEMELEEFNNECGKCHVSCGQCHVSRPRSVLGGFVQGWGHEFKKKPDMSENCTACHGSRVGEEYMGERAGVKADVHYIKLAKSCEFCHPANQMHGGDGNLLTYRYDSHNTVAPKCEGCHPPAQYESSNDYHKEHWSASSGVTLACQVCHSQPYKNCSGCHVGGDGITGSSYIAFEIGRNYLNGNERYEDYDYITVRHIPIAPNTFEGWGVDDLPNFATTEPTWKLTTPHNIQRWTPQTEVADGESCSSACHDSEYYLREEDIEFYETANEAAGYGYDDLGQELQANRDVIIPR